MEHPNYRKNLEGLKRLRDSGVNVPSLDKIPVLDPHGRIFWRAWESLNRKRVINKHGPQPIQVSEILAYANLMAVTDQDDREDLLYHIGILDPIFLNHEYDRLNKEAKKASQRARRNSRRGR